MPVFNAELAAKAQERRIDGLQRMIEAIEKSARTAGDNAKQVSDLEKLVAAQAKRIEDLEKLVKTLVESRGDSKVVALEKLAATANSMVVDNERRLREVREESKTTRAEVLEMMKVQRMSEEGIEAAMSRFDDKVRREIDAREKKIRDDIQTKQAELTSFNGRHWERLQAEMKSAQEATEAKVRKEADELVKKHMENMQKTMLDVRFRDLRTEIEAVRTVALSKR